MIEGTYMQRIVTSVLAAAAVISGAEVLGAAPSSATPQANCVVGRDADGHGGFSQCYERSGSQQVRVRCSNGNSYFGPVVSAVGGVVSHAPCPAGLTADSIGAVYYP
ncbi:hypothetical protein [Amycolatopsis sp. CA-128772]|uniref:hypothetical protein n=1 Tax=Amycolatopsis sp. CA-128772 TaxID=2073159 RepID=UPI000CD044C2|nr:hypothetical protein [Amycolatopsis sp. CA-128772]